MTILSLVPLRRVVPPQAPDAGDVAASHALADAQAAPADGEAERACGWFDSSWELRQGLAVSELPEAELPVAALWFAQLLPVVLPELLPDPAPQAGSAWLQ